jgi:hypothetical protein
LRTKGQIARRLLVGAFCASIGKSAILLDGFEMTITSQQLEELMREVEMEDPVDFADLPFDEEALRALVAERLIEMTEAMDSFSEEDRYLSLLAVSAKLLLENLVLHVQLLRRDGIPLDDNSAALLRRLQQRK